MRPGRFDARMGCLVGSVLPRVLPRMLTARERAQVNKAVHTAVGPDLQRLAKEKHGTAKTGHAYTVELPRSCDLRSIDHVRWVINVLGASPWCVRVRLCALVELATVAWHVQGRP